MRWFRKLHASLAKPTRSAEMDEEMRTHLELLAAEFEKSGMSADAAHGAARRAFGGVEQIKERVRGQIGFPWLESVGQDIRYAIRQLRKAPGLTCVAVLTLALGIGANTTVFSVVEKVLLKSLPVKEPDRLVLFCQTGTIRANHPRWRESNGGMSPVIYHELRERGASLVEVFAFGWLRELNATIDDQPEVVPMVHVGSGNYFATLGLVPAAGRLLAADDDRAAAAPTAVLSYRYWKDRFDCDPAALGKTIWINAVTATIVGVAPQEFAGTAQVGEPPEVYLPLTLAPRLKPDVFHRYDLDQPSFWWLGTMGRLRPWVTADQVRLQLDAALREKILVDYPETEGKPDQPHLRVTRCDRGLGTTEEFRQTLLILSGMVGLVLVITCVNLANLLLTRGAARRKEIAVRLSLGATRQRVVRQLLVESILLVALGGSLGVLFAWWGKDLLLAQRPLGGLVIAPKLDFGVLAFTAAAGSVTGLLFGLAPALRSTRIDLSAEFHGGAGGGGARRNRLGLTLIAAQVAISLVLLVGAGLFVHSLQQLEAVEIGFDRSHLLLFRVDAAMDDPLRAESIYQRLNDKFAALPGVRASTFSSLPLLSHEYESHGGSLRGESGLGRGGRNNLGGATNGVGPNFFRTFGMQLLAGRGIEARDLDANVKVAVLNESMVRKFFGDEDPIGQRTNYGEIIGVVRDAKYDELKKPFEPTAYVAYYRYESNRQGHFALRITGNPAAATASVRDVVGKIDPKLPIFDVRTQDEQIERLLQPERMFARLARFFAVLALALVGVGLYGLMSYTVHQRTREIGVRMALGALPGEVLRMILAQSLTVVGFGIALGLGGAVAAVRLVKNQLYGVSPADGPSYALAILLLMAVALAAAWLPGRRAAKVDPMVALRCE